MSVGSINRLGRQSRPALEGLEGRALMAARPTAAALQATTGPVVVTDKNVSYQTPEGSRVSITLYGLGSLQGTTVDPDGGLNLRFRETNEASGIIGQVTGGTGRAPIRSMIHANLPAASVSGIGSSLINVVKLKDFDLVNGGRINLTGGVHTFFLNSVGSNTQVNLREIPPNVLNQTSTTSATENGVTLGFLLDVAGARSLTQTSGAFLPGTNLLANTTTAHPNTHPAPAGIVAVVNTINGSARPQGGLGAPELFGYDPVTNSLVRFNAATGSPDLTIPNALPASTPDAGVSLARNDGRLVVLVSDGKAVQAYNPTDGTKVGSFGVTNLLAGGLAKPTKLGNVDSFTVIGDPNSGTSGLIQILDVTNSIKNGQAVVVGVPFAATREFGLSGGMTGIPGSSTLYAGGGAHFDAFQPDRFQFGVASLSPTTVNGAPTFRESSRTAVTNGGQTVNSSGQGATPASPDAAVGAVDLNLGVVTGSNGTANTVTLYSPSNFARSGSITLNNPNLLSGISSVFRPTLAGSALFDVQGNVQSFRAKTARGLVLNDTGNLNLVKIDQATDTTIVGLPFGHAAIPRRNNVTIVSSARTPGDRNGVTVIPNIRPTGPLTLPY